MVSKSAETLAADLAQSSATQPGCAGLTTGAERILAAVLADVMHAERVPADSNFFDDLGADSMLMAQFRARVRKRGDLPPVSIRDIYVNTKIQCHSQEDGTFKSDRTTLGAGCTLGVGAMVHYGVTMGAGVVLAADSFLMKGEEVPPHAWWGGNPAGEM